MTDVKKACEGFITFQEAKDMSKEDAISLQKEYQNHERVKLAEQLGAAQQFVGAGENGVELFDSDGNRHLDFIGGVGVMTVGSCNKHVWNAIEQAKDIPAIHALAVRPMSAVLANNISKLSGGKLKKVWFGTSGSEASEAAIKISKMSFKGTRHKFVSVYNGYHGKTTGALSLSKVKWALHQSPLMPGVSTVKMGDVHALEEALKYEDVAAFFIEPVQGEGGIHVASDEYLKAARELCTKYGTLMVVDEIQCGLGRTGKMWAHQHAGIEPDLVIFAKGISGGYMPLAGYICTEKLWNDAYGTPATAFHHTVTYGNNILSCSAGIASLEYLLENDLMDKATEKGEYMMKKLTEIKSSNEDVIKEVRGKGLMIGIEFHAPKETDSEAFAAVVAATMMNKYRIQTLFSINNPVVVRALPPLAVTYEQMDEFLTSFESAIGDAKETMNV